VALLAWFVLSFSPGRFMVSRRATPREDTLYYFAQQIGDPALCEQISWRVYASYSVMFAGGGASYLRSDCFERSAAARQQPSICLRVRPLLDFDWFSPGYSALACRRRTLSRETSGTALSDEVFVGAFEAMGYDIDHMPSDAIFPPAIALRDVYSGLEKNPAAVALAERSLTQRSSEAAADPPTRDASDDRYFLADLAAIATSDPKWCDYIPAGFALGAERPAFRDWCLYTLAKNTEDSKICARMAPAAEDRKVIDNVRHGVRPEVAEQFTLRAQCERIDRDRALSMHLHYSAEVPADREQVLRLLASLGVTMPSAHRWTLNERAIYFRNFLFALAPRYHDAIHDAVRGELVRRLRALPEEE
jgi:hypothetical protein